MKKPSVRKNFLQQLRKLPIISSACAKIGLSRQTYYRWRNENPEFAQEVEDAISEGEDHTNDFVENKLLAKIEEGNMDGIKFYLGRRHKKYKDQKIDPFLVNITRKDTKKRDQSLMTKASEKVKAKKIEYFRENEKISIDETSLRNLYKWSFIDKDLYETLSGEKDVSTSNEMISEDLKSLEPTPEEVQEEYLKLKDEKEKGDDVKS